MDFYYKISLVVDTEDSHPSIISDISGIPASKIILKGSNFYDDPKTPQMNLRKNKYNLWYYTLLKEETVDFILSEYLDSIIKILVNDKLLEIIRKFENKSIQVDIKTKDYHQYISPSMLFINFLSNNNINFIVDTYYFTE